LQFRENAEPAYRNLDPHDKLTQKRLTDVVNTVRDRAMMPGADFTTFNVLSSLCTAGAVL
jgi:hypothetical protein